MTGMHGRPIYRSRLSMTNSSLRHSSTKPWRRKSPIAGVVQGDVVAQGRDAALAGHTAEELEARPPFLFFVEDKGLAKPTSTGHVPWPRYSE